MDVGQCCYAYNTNILPTNSQNWTPPRASAGRSSIRHWRKDLTNDEKKCNSFRQFDESIKTKYFHWTTTSIFISSSCLSGNNHALPQHPPNPVNALSIRRVYFPSNAANHTKPPCGFPFGLTRVTRETSPLVSQLSRWWWRRTLALIGRDVHVLVLRMRTAFHRWGFPVLCLPTATRERFYACVR